MKKPELLAPVGNIECLYAAIEAGCDAVYLSGKLYGARNFAGNFSNEELVDAIKICHLYGIKVYVTINTLIYEAEVDNFIRYVEFLYINNVDAVIIQDIGMFDLIRKIYPNLELHISTQMHVHNLEGVHLMEELGADRVVLARETPFELVKKIKENTNIELEIFVHGALCISYSGQCLMSSLIGGRSGNRGTCAQCCRQPYDLYENDTKINKDNYLLSTRDLNSLENLGKLIEIGVDSLKIEGRMKRPEYVYLIISTYRKAIDNYLKYKDVRITDNDIKEIKKIFNRKFTKGFLFNTKNDEFINSYRPNHQGIEIGKVISVKHNNITIKLTDDLNVQDGIRFIGSNDSGLTVQTMLKNNQKVKEAFKNDIISLYSKDIPKVGDIVVKTTDNNQLNRINNLINSKLRKVKIDLAFSAHIGNNILITITDGYNTINNTSLYIVDKSINNPTKKEDIIKQLNKLGDTIYEIDNISIDIDDNIFIPVKVINELRRDTVNMLSEKKLYNNDIKYGTYEIDVPDFDVVNKKVIYTKKYNEDLLTKYDEVIVDYNADTKDDLRRKLPRVQENIIETNGKLLIGELGSLYKYRDKDIVTDFSFNVVNSYSVALLHSLGVNRITLSHEMNDYQINKLITKYKERYNKNPNLELIVEDLIEAMIIKYDLFNGKYNKNNKYYLKDKFGNKFRVIRDNNLTYVYNFESLKRENINTYYEMGINYLRKNSIF